MRAVTTPDFCAVCTEGLWLALLARVELVESLAASCVRSSDNDKLLRRLDAVLVPLAHLRDPVDKHIAEHSNETYTIRWFHDHEEVLSLANRTFVEVDGERDDGLGAWEIEVTFGTKEIRKDVARMTRGWAGVYVAERCSYEG
jgi:hypothetical protein